MDWYIYDNILVQTPCEPEVEMAPMAHKLGWRREVTPRAFPSAPSSSRLDVGKFEIGTASGAGCYCQWRGFRSICECLVGITEYQIHPKVSERPNFS